MMKNALGILGLFLSLRRQGARLRLLHLAACVALALTSSTALAYRTGEDGPALAGKGRIAWRVVRVPFFLNSHNLPNGLAKQDVEQVLSQALQTWSTTDCGVVEPFFAGWTEREAEPRDGLNTVAWVANWAARDLVDSAPGYTDMQYRGRDEQWEIAETDIYLNATDFEWSVSAGEDTSVRAVLVHELGHALGLLHPCEPDGEEGAPLCDHTSAETAEATMFPFYAQEQSSLAEDDIAGLCYLYPTGNDCGDPCGRGERCLDGECRSVCGSGLCAVGEACGFWGCSPAGACLERDCVGQLCEADGACGPLASCKEGMCEAGTARWGDGCAESHDCEQGACVEGTCQPTCQSDLECGPLGSCVATANGRARGCTSSGAYEQGMHCALGEDCRSSICLLTEKPAICTNECQNDAGCPRDWACQSVEGRDVCVPRVFEPGGGCGLTLNRGPQARLGWMLAAATLLAARMRRRRKNL